MNECFGGVIGVADLPGPLRLTRPDPAENKPKMRNEICPSDSKINLDSYISLPPSYRELFSAFLSGLPCVNNDWSSRNVEIKEIFLKGPKCPVSTLDLESMCQTAAFNEVMWL